METSERAAGRHAVQFDAGRLAAGLYLVRLRTPTAAAVAPLTIVR